MTRTDSDLELTATASTVTAFEVIAPRDVPLGGPRAMTVRRTLPSRQRTMVGAWCFLDHYGPDSVADSGGMSVPPHPHTGLQTVSWLFDGEIDHRDSTGVSATVRPGTLNLMTAGRGIQHSEISTPTTTTLHGVQLWVALPDSARHIAPRFDTAHAVKKPVGNGDVAVFLGSLPGVGGVDAPTYTALVAAQIDLPPHGTMMLSLHSESEHAILVDSGDLTTDRGDISRHHLGVLPHGAVSWSITAGDEPVRALLIGGEPLGEEIVMWWNFVGRSHDEIVQARTSWQDGLRSGSERFGHLDHLPPLPAPEMPTVTLKPRH